MVTLLCEMAPKDGHGFAHLHATMVQFCLKNHPDSSTVVEHSMQIYHLMANKELTLCGSLESFFELLVKTGLSIGTWSRPGT